MVPSLKAPISKGIVGAGFAFVVVIGLILPVGVRGQGKQTLTWSSKGCSACESTVKPGWYTDGSGLFIEGIEGQNAGVLVGVSLMNGHLVVDLGLALQNGKQIVFKPREEVAIETDSEPSVLVPLSHPPGIPKGLAKQQLKDSLRLSGGEAESGVTGLLFFPADDRITQLTVVLKIGTETFRFPFSRNPGFRSKFEDPQGLGPSMTAEEALAQYCEKNISVGIANGSQVAAVVPDFAAKWIQSNQKNYPKVCFWQKPLPNKKNYVLIFANSQQAFTGVEPVLRRSTTTSTTPLSGSGTVTDNYGATWNFTSSGTETTTSTTTTIENLPYTLNTNTLYVNTYDQNGRVLSQRSKTVSQKIGGDPSSSLGYNLASALMAIHLRQHLLKEAVDDVMADTAAVANTAPRNVDLNGHHAGSSMPAQNGPKATVSCSSVFLYDKEMYSGERQIVETLARGSVVSLQGESGTTIEYRVKTSSRNEGYVAKNCLVVQ